MFTEVSLEFILINIRWRLIHINNLVPQVGFEPTRPSPGHRILSPARATNFATGAVHCSVNENRTRPVIPYERIRTTIMLNGIYEGDQGIEP